MKTSIVKRLSNLEELLPAPMSKLRYDLTLLSDGLLEALVDAEGDLEDLTPAQLAELQSALIKEGTGS